jgi:phospholipase C
MALTDIDTIIVVFMENRSFDHMLGYLSLPGQHQMAVEGLSADPNWIRDHANLYKGEVYQTVRLDPSMQSIVDPCHNWDAIAVQIDTKPASGAGKMGGFVQSFAEKSSPAPAAADYWKVMGHYDAEAVPMYDFFARNFVVCDHWFCPLPAGTQPNRLMAMSGYSGLYANGSSKLPHQTLVYDWLDENGKDWCSYTSGDFLPFFALDWERLPGILESLVFTPGSGHWRRYSHFGDSWRSSQEMPPVIFIEPEYSDSLVHDPNDDHSPAGIAPGQAFLRQIYADLISSPARWAKTMMIVTYDEHGGFFDHVPPLGIPAIAGGHQFETTGLRVPAFVISPQVSAAEVFDTNLDHTSILELLAEKFTLGHGYSDAVNERQKSLDRLSRTLQPIAAEPRRPAAPAFASPPAPAPVVKPADQMTNNEKAFRATAQQAWDAHRDLVNHPNLSSLREKMVEEGLIPDTGE